MDDDYEKFETLLQSVLFRTLERARSDATLFRLFAAHAEAACLISTGIKTDDPRFQSLLDSHSKVVPGGVALADQEYSRDAIIVCATIFDSFLTDLTRFLLLLRPTAIPKDRQIRFGDVIQSTSLSALITESVAKYCHELSYKSFQHRIDFLHEKFGFPMEEIQEDIAECARIADLRNRLVHVVSRFSYSSGDGTGSVQVIQQELPKVTPEIASEAMISTEKAIYKLADLVSQSIFKRSSKLAAEMSSFIGGPQKAVPGPAVP
ncbi:hypothetical protein [Lysobacter enzymogenes]|uniref:hypothetical protein n=1 Tax=Lysobacter enzymogenes TaxID=69 RepID=UPI000F4B68F5|nr:hypothetical protein [Lysobacter enzymogenes]